MSADNANARAQPFATFWQAGYEGADHVNHAGHAPDMNATTGHLARAHADYAQLAPFGIQVTSIVPGGVLTGMSANSHENTKKTWAMQPEAIHKV